MSDSFLAKAQAEAEKRYPLPQGLDPHVCMIRVAKGDGFEAGAQFGYTEREREIEDKDGLHE